MESVRRLATKFRPKSDKARRSSESQVISTDTASKQQHQHEQQRSSHAAGPHGATSCLPYTTTFRKYMSPQVVLRYMEQNFKAGEFRVSTSPSGSVQVHSIRFVAEDELQFMRAEAARLQKEAQKQMLAGPPR